MNNWQTEFMAEYHRQQILMDAEEIHLQKIAARPSLFEKTMFNFANWMITTGKQMRKRYEIAAVQCSHTPTGSFAH